MTKSDTHLKIHCRKIKVDTAIDNTIEYDVKSYKVEKNVLKSMKEHIKGF